MTVGNAVGPACNVAREGDLVVVVQLAVDRFGGISVLVYNAGGGGPSSFDIPLDDIHWAFALNLSSLFRLKKPAVPHVEKVGGATVLNMPSMAGVNNN